MENRTPPSEQPRPAAPQQKKSKKKVWGWGIAAFIIASLAFSGGQNDPSKSNLTTDTKASSTSSVQQNKDTTPKPAVTATESPAPAPAPEPAPEPKPTPAPAPSPAPAASSSNLSNNNTYTNSAGNTVHSPASTTDGSIPAGATAQCADGTFSFSQSRRGTCSHHGGVASWL